MHKTAFTAAPNTYSLYPYLRTLYDTRQLERASSHESFNDSPEHIRIEIAFKLTA
jgi:hypothetical protein